MRYKVVVHDAPPEPGLVQPFELKGQRVRTKKEISAWIDNRIDALGLDWRVGYQVKFMDSDAVFTWRWIKNDKEVKFRY